MSSIQKYQVKSSGKTQWRVQYISSIDPLTGKKHKNSKRGFKTRAAAKDFLNKKLAEINDYGYAENTDIDYKQVYEYFLLSYKNTVKGSTLNRVKGLFKHHILPAIGSFKVKEITSPMCQEVVNEWSKELSSFKMLKYYASLVFNEARRLKIIYENPMDMIIMPKIEQKIGSDELTNFWTRSQEQHFFDELNIRCGHGQNDMAIALFRLSFFTGMRKGELLALQIDDINFDKRTLRINKTVSRGEDGKPTITVPKTRNSNRIVGLDTKTINILKKWIVKLRRRMVFYGFNIDTTVNQLLFPNTRNKLLGLTKMNRWLDYLIKSYNHRKKDSDEPLNRINVHGIRHTVCSLMLESGASIKEVQLQLGHSDTQMILKIYWHISSKAQLNTVNKLSKFANF